MVRRTTLEASLAQTGGGETVRAFAIFFGLLVVWLWAAYALAFEDLSRLTAANRRQAGVDEAQHIADAVTALGRSASGLDFSRIQQNRDFLQDFLTDRLKDHPDLRWIEVRDKFQVPVAVVRTALIAAGDTTIPAKAPLILGGIPQGEVRVGISTVAINRDIESLRRSLAVKVAIAAAIGAGLLVVGLIYVLNLIRKNRILEKARQSAQRAAERGIVGSGIAHEIRNPLNSMNMNLQMLEEELQGARGLEGSDTIEMLRSMQGEIKRIKSLIDNFLQFSRPATPHFEIKSLNEVLTTIARFLQADFRQSEVDLSVDLEPLLPSVEIDEAQLRQALLNILGNARQVVPAGGSVRIASRAGSGGDVIVEIADTGPGIPAEVLEKIFEPFFSKRAGGTGLGLAIARQMIENHEGRIEVESTPGRGTTFRIRLPRRQRPTESSAPGRAAR